MKAFKNLQSKTLSLYEFEVPFHVPFHSSVILFKYLTFGHNISFCLWNILSNVYNSPSSLLLVCFSKKNLVLLSMHKYAYSSIVFMLKTLLQIGQKNLLGLKNLRYSRVLLGSLAEVVRGLVGLSVLCSDIDGSCIFLCFVVVWTETREKERYLLIHLHHYIRILFLLPSNNIWRLKDRWCLNTTRFYAHFFVFNGFAINCII